MWIDKPIKTGVDILCSSQYVYISVGNGQGGLVFQLESSLISFPYSTTMGVASGSDTSGGSHFLWKFEVGTILTIF